ncbi:MAG TPA: formate/nitrite transporter family protein [Dehalococcoidia bacterium]|nr:formate/nitrite transporter family protein [Dehalococcoidia bacterium]
MYREDEPDGLTDRDREGAAERTRPPVRVIHEAIRREGTEELNRASTGLAWSGFAAGLSMGFSLVAQGLLRFYLPDADWTPLIWRLGYPVGFLIVVLGRQELFTETTLTAVVPLFSRRNIDTLLDTLRVWGIVLVANLAGAALFAVVLADLHVFDTPMLDQFAYIGTHAAEGSWGAIVIHGIFAGG